MRDEKVAIRENFDLHIIIVKPNTLITLYCNRTKAQTSVTGKCT